MEVFVCIHREFPHESVGEKILKIGPHLPKLLSNIQWLPILRDSVLLPRLLAEPWQLRKLTQR